MFKFFVVILLVSGWITGVVAGFVSLDRFESTPGAGVAKQRLSVSTAGNWRFVLVVSPDCPCSRASINALKAAVDSHPESTVAEVVFVGQPNRDVWMVRRAASIHGCSIKTALSDAYGARTSGQAYLYNPSGHLVYAGGLTQGRGVDDTRYAMNLYDSARSQTPLPKAGPVFGCELPGATR